jgi:endopeptidase Clp ATP-binding regulatory subunit ClpX
MWSQERAAIQKVLVKNKKAHNMEKIPSPDEIQKEFEEFVQKKFGGHVQVVSHEINMPSRQPAVGAGEKKKGATPPAAEFSFCYKPKEITAHLDRFVIGQHEAKKALAIAICDHYNNVVAGQKSGDKSLLETYAKQNVLILGPTGVGKTYLLKHIAKLIGVPMVKADATRFSETGYMGANVDDLIKDLVFQAEGSLARAQYGIVYLDEADKLATAAHHSGRDVSGRGVQLGLLKLMEETEVDLRGGHDPAAQMQAFMEMQQKGKVEKQVINTRHILFIISGAFTGLEEIISKRVGRQHIGFARREGAEEAARRNILQQANTEDFIAYGFEPEFIGRLPVRVACEHLDKIMLLAILRNSEESIIKQYRQSFRSYGIEVLIEDSALEKIAELAAQEKTGARALLTIGEKIFRDFKYELPSTDVFEFTVTAETVAHPQESLAALLAASKSLHLAEMKKIRSFELVFTELHQMRIKFSAAACQALIQLAHQRQLEVSLLCQEVLQSYEHGLKLIQQNTGKNEFLLGKEIVENPKEELEKMVKESYNH